MIVRDKDVLADLSARTECSVCISVPCVDEDVWRALEPGTAHPLQRLRAVRELVDAGMHAGVLMDPIVPGISSKPALIERTVKADADHGARFVGSNVMHLKAARATISCAGSRQSIPSSWTATENSMPPSTRPKAYREEVTKVLDGLRTKYETSVLMRARGSRN